MSLTYGFYNSLVTNGTHDRTYDAVDFAKIFSGIITDGIFSDKAWGGDQNEMFRLKAGSGMRVAVGTGRAWFNDTWTHNDSDYVITNIQVGHATLKRIDVIVLTIDKGNRINSIGVVAGTSSNGGLGASPRVPSVESGYSTVKNYRLGYVTIPAGTTQITQSMITQTPLPYITAPLDKADLVTTGLYSQWQAQFTEWFASVQNIINDQTITNLTSRVTNIENNGVSKLTTARAIDGVNFNGTTNISHYGTCSTSASTAAKTVSVSNYTLVNGAYVIVNFSNTNTATRSNLTLNVNSTGAKPIKYRGATPPVEIRAGLYLFVYDGTNYELISAGMENINGAVPSSGTNITGVFPFASSATKFSMEGTNTVDDIQYLFGATATAPFLYNDNTDTTIWTGYTTLNKPSPSDIGAVPTTRKVNNKALSSDITLTGADINAYSSGSTKISTVLSTAATTTNMGMMSAADKAKLNGIAANANNYTYTLPTASASTLGGIKVGTNLSISNGILSVPTASGATAGVVKVGANLGISNGVLVGAYQNATSSTSGLMRSTDKDKLDHIAYGAEVNELKFSNLYGRFQVYTFNLTSLEMASGGSIEGSTDKLPTYSTARAIGLVGWHLTGTNSNMVNIPELYIDDSTQKVYYRFRNMSTSSVNVSCKINVLTVLR